MIARGRGSAASRVIPGSAPDTTFPFDYRFGILELLYALSKMGYGDHSASVEVWTFLDGKWNGTGRYILERTMPKRLPGREAAQADKWVTLYAYLAMKHRATAGSPS